MDPLKSFQFSMDPVTPVPTLGIQSHPNHLHNFKALSEFVFWSYSLVKPLSNPFSDFMLFLYRVFCRIENIGGFFGVPFLGKAARDSMGGLHGPFFEHKKHQAVVAGR